VTIKYSFEFVKGTCEEPSVEGCRKYDPFAAQRTIVEWSAWVKDEYKTASKAWSELAGPMKEAHDSIEGEIVPYYKWGYVWGAWPHSEDKGAAWTDVFHYISGGQEFVTMSDFDRAFDLGNVSAAATAATWAAAWAAASFAMASAALASSQASIPLVGPSDMMNSAAAVAESSWSIASAASTPMNPISSASSSAKRWLGVILWRL